MSKRSSPEVGAAGWAATSSSVRGSSHDRTGLPNQDAVAVLSLDGALAGVVVAAVADGHGGQRYVRSGAGSAFAVEIACAIGAEICERLGSAPEARQLERALLEAATPAIVKRWREAVTADVASNPFAAEEHVTGGADLDSEPLVAYGSTLILALIMPTLVGLLQIGDGDALVVTSAGLVSDPVPGDDRLVGGETTSLCLPTAVADARAAVVAVDDVELVVLCSDGYGNSFASPQWRHDAGVGFLDAVRAGGLAGVEAKLPGWLADSAEAGGDDVTMVVAHRDGPVTVPAPVQRPSTGAAVRGRRRRPRRWPALVGAVVIASLAGGAVGWLVRGGGDSSSSGAAATTADDTASSTSPGTAADFPDPPVQSMLLRGEVLSFSQTTNGDAVRPRITLRDVTLRASVKSTDGTLTARVGTFDRKVTVAREGQPEISLDLDKPAEAVRVIGEQIWVASANKDIKAFDASGTELVPWQALEREPGSAG